MKQASLKQRLRTFTSLALVFTVALGTIQFSVKTAQAASVTYPQFLMTASACTEELSSEYAPASNAIDGLAGTFWHTRYGSNNDNTAHTNPTKVGAVSGHWYQVDLGVSQVVTAIRYLPRQDSANGRITNVRIYVSTNGSNFTEVAANSSWGTATTERTLACTPTAGRYVLMVGAAPASYNTCAEFNVEVEESGRGPVWATAKTANDTVKNVSIGTTPKTYSEAAQTACLDEIRALALSTGTETEIVAAINKAVADFLANPNHYTLAQLQTRIDSVDTLLHSYAIGTTDGTIPQSAYDKYSALLASARVLHANPAALADDIDDMCGALDAAVPAIKSAVLTLTPDLKDGNFGVYNLAVNIDPDAIRFNNLEWTGNTSVAAGLPNQGRQSSIVQINRVKPHAQTYPYESLAKAIQGAMEYKREVSKYFMPLTTPDDLDPLKSNWTFSLVRTLTRTAATANSTKDPLGGNQNIVDFYKSGYDASKWNKIAVPCSIQLQGVKNGVPYKGYFDPEYGYDPPYYTNISMPGSVTVKGVSYNIFNSVSIPQAPNDYNPVGFYRRTFDVPSEWIANKHKVFISFEGVENTFYLYLNGKEVGYHTDSKTTAEFDLTPFLTTDGKNNLLAVKVFRWGSNSWIDDQDYLRLSGIFRDVFLTATPFAHIQDYKVETKFDSDYENATINFRVDAANFTTENLSGYGVVAQLFDKNNVDVLKDRTFKTALNPFNANSEVRVTGSVTVVNPHKWFPDDPYLYTLVLTLFNSDNVAVERVSCPFGFSQVTFRDANDNSDMIRLNGKKIMMRGTNRHDNSPDGGRYVSRARYLDDLLIMKSHNINTIRTSHYPSDPYLYYLADKYGLMIIDEANNESHAVGNSALTADNCKAMAQQRVLNVVERDKNHPSVVMWSLGNESGGGNDWRDIVQALREQGDYSRPVHYEGIADNNVGNTASSRLRNMDVRSRMYASVSESETLGNTSSIGAYVQCEYAHAMGNSVGNLREYMDVYLGTPRSIGGCLWEYADHSAWTKPAASGVLSAESGPYKIVGKIAAASNAGAFETVNGYQTLKPAVQISYANSAGEGGQDIFNQYISGTNSFSLEVWASQTSVAADRIFISKGDSQFNIKTKSTSQLEFFIYSNGWQVATATIGTGTGAISDFTDGKIHHIVGTYNGSTGVLTLYWDGRQVATTTIAAGAARSITTNSFPVSVGRETEKGNASISNLYGARIYSRVLTTAEIGANAYTTAPADASGLLLNADYTNANVAEIPPEIFDYYGNGLYLGVGGDWGEGNHDGHFCADGINVGNRRDVQIDPDMNEIKKVYAPMVFVASNDDLKKGVVKARNEYYAKNLKDFDFVWTLYEDDKALGGGKIDTPSVPPMTNQLVFLNIPTVDVPVPFLGYLPDKPKPGAEYFLKVQACLKADEDWAKAGYPLCEEQFDLGWFVSGEKVKLALTDVPKVEVKTNTGTQLIIGNDDFSVTFNKGASGVTGGTITNYTAKGETLLTAGPRPTFWRALMGNDRVSATNWINADNTMTVSSFGNPVVDYAGRSISFTVTYLLSAVSTSTYVDMIYTVLGTGAIQVTTSMRTTNTNQLYRFGVDMTMPAGFENIDWYARGPIENLNDRMTGSFPSRFQTTVWDNYFAYAMPQDTGTHQDTRFIALTSNKNNMGMMVAATGARLFESNALHFNWRDMNSSSSWNGGKKHPYELKPREETIVSASYGSRGTGGASCGPATLTQYTLQAGNLSYSYTIVPFKKASDDLMALSKFYRNTGLSGVYLMSQSTANGVEATLNNTTTADTAAANVILAIYNSRGALAYIDNVGYSAVKAGSSEKALFNFNRAEYAGCTFKVFAWESQSLAPMCEMAQGVL